MRYVATINTPGYLPWDDDPPVFDTASEAWDYLKEEFERAVDGTYEAEIIRPMPEWNVTEVLASFDDLIGQSNQPGTVYTPSPDGWESKHDLGLAYCVTAINEED